MSSPYVEGFVEGKRCASIYFDDAKELRARVVIEEDVT